MRLEHCSEEARSTSKYSPCRMPQQNLLFPPGTCPRRRPCTMPQRFVLQQPRTCPQRSPCNQQCFLQVSTCLQHTLCILLCRRPHRSLHRKCMRLEHCSEEASSSSRYMPCRMPQRILLLPPGTCLRRRPCTMPQRFVLQQPRTCPHRRPCKMLQRFVP